MKERGAFTTKRYRESCANGTWYNKDGSKTDMHGMALYEIGVDLGKPVTDEIVAIKSFDFKPDPNGPPTLRDSTMGTVTLTWDFNNG